MASSLAREFELFDQSLILLALHRGDYPRVVNLIGAIKDDAIKCKLMAKHAQTLLKHEPKLVIAQLRLEEYEQINKLELIPALMAMDNLHHTLNAAGEYVDQVWIAKLEQHQTQFYNLAFQLYLRALVASRTTKEAKDYTTLLDFLNRLESSRCTYLDEKYASDLLHWQILETVQ